MSEVLLAEHANSNEPERGERCSGLGKLSRRVSLHMVEDSYGMIGINQTTCRTYFALACNSGAIVYGSRVKASCYLSVAQLCTYCSSMQRN